MRIIQEIKDERMIERDILRQASITIPVSKFEVSLQNFDTFIANSPRKLTPGISGTITSFFIN